MKQPTRRHSFREIAPRPTISTHHSVGGAGKSMMPSPLQSATANLSPHLLQMAASWNLLSPVPTLPPPSAGLPLDFLNEASGIDPSILLSPMPLTDDLSPRLLDDSDDFWSRPELLTLDLGPNMNETPFSTRQVPYRLDTSQQILQQLQLQQQAMSAVMPLSMNSPYTPSPFTPSAFNASNSNYMEPGLSSDQMEALLQTANSYGTPTRSKRDLAIICLLLDAHMSCGMVASLSFSSIPTLVQAVLVKENVHSQEHDVHLPEQYATTRSTLRLHPFTAWALYRWVQELSEVYAWPFEVDAALPLFVNALPVLPEGHDSVNEDTHESVGASTPLSASSSLLTPSTPSTATSTSLAATRPVLRKVALKRDAISKVMAAVKQRSGVHFSRRQAANVQFDRVLSQEFILNPEQALQRKR